MGNPVVRLTDSASQSSDDESSSSDNDFLSESEPFLQVLAESPPCKELIHMKTLKSMVAVHFSDDDEFDSSESGESVDHSVHSVANAKFRSVPSEATPSSDDELEKDGCDPDPLHQCPSLCQVPHICHPHFLSFIAHQELNNFGMRG